jgi:hypothetical protein
MNGKRLVAIIILLTILATGILRPAPARAVDTWVLVVGSIAAYVAVVAVGTILYRRSRSASELLDTQRDADAAQRERVNFVQRCPQNSGNLTVVCW